MRPRIVFLSIALIALCSGLAYGQAGDPDYHYVRSEAPVIMEIDLGDVQYDFAGEATIPFTLRNSRAHIWLVVYTKDQPTPEGFGGPTSPVALEGALWRKEGIPNMVTVVDKGQFEEGSHTITWDGTNWPGEKVEAGTYTLYVIGLNDQDDANVVGIVGISGLALHATDVLLDSAGEGWVIGTTRGILGTSSANYTMMNRIGQSNWLEDLSGFNPIFVPNMVAAFGVCVDPDNIFRQWGCAIYDNPGSEENPHGYTCPEGKTCLGSNSQGIGAGVVAGDFSEATPLAGFGNENSQVPVLTDNANRYNVIHYHNGLLYIGHGWQTDPPESDIYVVDAETGDVVNVIDCSEWYVLPQIDEETQEEIFVASAVGALYWTTRGSMSVTVAAAAAITDSSSSWTLRGIPSG
jgi:hypothetical protein